MTCPPDPADRQADDGVPPRAVPVAPPALVAPVHPERTSDPATLRWVVADGLGAGPWPALDALVADGVLVAVRVDGGRVLTTLAPGREWATDREAAAAVRAAVQASAVRPGAAADPGALDALLTAEARDVIDELVDPTARAHGGAVELVDVSGGVVTVRLHGACDGCPAAAATLQGRLDAGLRRRVPGLVEVAVDPSGARSRPSGERSPLRLVLHGRRTGDH